MSPRVGSNFFVPSSPGKSFALVYHEDYACVFVPSVKSHSLCGPFRRTTAVLISVALRLSVIMALIRRIRRAHTKT